MSDSRLLDKNEISESERDSDEIEYGDSFEPSFGLRLRQKRGILHCLSSQKWLWAIHLAFLTINIGVFVLFGESLHSSTDFTIDGIIPYPEAPIEFVQTRIAPGGVHNNHNLVLNDYEGRPNERNNAAWGRLMEAGFTNLNEAEYSRMKEETALNIDGKGGRVVAISVFHQLHCVNLLRRRIWDAEESIPQSTHPLRVPHLDHCLDYLRQVLMCNGDLSPNTFSVAPGGKGYVPSFNESHQCRDFEKIFDWAKKRNNGVSIDPPLF